MGRENTCSIPTGRKSHFIFMGDCMARQSFQAYVRNRKGYAGGPFDARLQSELLRMTEDERMIERLMMGILEDQVLQENQTSVLERMIEHMPKRMFTHEDASFVDWLSGDVDEAIRRCRELLQANALDPRQVSITVWADYAIHAFFTGRKEWIWDREAQLRKFVVKFRAEFPRVRLAWMTTNYIDMEIMGAKPHKMDFGHFEDSGVPQITRDQVAVDERVMKSFGVPVVPRAEVSAAYRGLQCDGLHNEPHSNTHAEAWDCLGFPAVEDLILQAGLASLCDASGLQSICATS